MLGQSGITCVFVGCGTFIFKGLIFFPSPVFSLVSWKKCLHHGSSSAWTVASRTSVSGSSVPHYFFVSCAPPSCLPVSSTLCRSILMTAHLAPWLWLPRSFRTWLTLPSRYHYHKHFLILKNTSHLKFGWGWVASSLILQDFLCGGIKNKEKRRKQLKYSLYRSG